MRLETWRDKITDGSNLWLNATRAEDEGNFTEATMIYLKDAGESLSAGLPARAALSCSCAANCLERTGSIDLARNLYFEAAGLYEEGAKAAFGRSIREALWLLQEASEYFALGGDKQRASEILDRYVSLARRVNPFKTTELVGDSNRIKSISELLAKKRNSAAPQTSEVRRAIEGFLRLKDSEARASKSTKADPLNPSSWRETDEKSIIS